jgi:hypothetical protein
MPRLSSVNHLSCLQDSCVNSLMWSMAEVGTAILCASIPSIKALVSILPPGCIFCNSCESPHQSAISMPYDLRHLSGISSSLGPGSLHSRMSLAKRGTVARVYTSGSVSDEEYELESPACGIGVALSTPDIPQTRPESG